LQKIKKKKKREKNLSGYFAEEKRVQKYHSRMESRRISRNQILFSSTATCQKLSRASKRSPDDEIRADYV
jgi:hypothetical protein